MPRSREAGPVRRDGPRTRAAGPTPERTNARTARRVGVAGARAIVVMALLGGIARAQSAPPTSPPPAAAPTPVPIEPLTAGPADAPPLVTPEPLAAPAPAAPADAPLIVPAAAPDNGPFYQKWWFWTAVGAAAVTTLAILIATSGSSAPHTDFGNMPAF
jgi:hypothetical protein